jgi:catechol 2,3-dioxygenase-like lactoylglutathione lyase family enzyme
MKFTSNPCIAIHVKDLAKAERFYTDVMGFKLLTKSKTYLEYETGSFFLYVNKGPKKMSPIPSFDVTNVKEARELLKKSGCKIIDDRKKSLYFKDPFGNVYDLVEK